MLADYFAMCSLLGPLDLERFCEGYAAHMRWRERWAGDTGELAAVVQYRLREGAGTRDTDAA